MKNANLILVVIGLIALASLWSFRPASQPDPVVAQADLTKTTGSIHTTGSAVLRVQPDKVTVHLGVQTLGATPYESHAKNAELIEAVLKAVRDKGVPTKDIGTDYFAIRPDYDSYDSAKQKVIRYRTDNTVVITLRQVDKLGDVLMAALEAGATTVDDVTFSTSRLRELRDEARTMAVKAALEKAQGVAGAANLKVGDVQSIDENSGSYYWGMWNSRGQWSNQWVNVQQNVAQLPSLEAPPEDGEFSLGQILVQAQVNLTVAIGK